MAEQMPTPAPSDVTSDDKLWAALAYVFSPIVPIIILLMEDKKNRPFIKAHNAQALVAGIVLDVILMILTTVTCGIGAILFIVWIVMLYWAYKAYQGEYVTIPVITDFVKKQNWA
jgi:uncharacterized membrane protein